MGGVFPRQREGPQIRQNESIHPGIVQALQMGGEGIHLAAAGHGIDGDVDPDAVVMGIGHRKGQFLRGEIPGEGAHAESGARKVHRIGARPRPFSAFSQSPAGDSNSGFFLIISINPGRTYRC